MKLFDRGDINDHYQIEMIVLNSIVIFYIFSMHVAPSALLYRPTFPVGLQSYILYQQWAVVCRF